MITIFLSLIAYFSGPLLFTNLYYIHAYYQYANNLFLSLAIGIFFLSILNDQRYKYKKFVVYLLLPIVSIFMLSGYFVKYYKVQKKGGGKFSFTETIKNNTSKDSVLLSYGFDWSSEVPYYAERKTISADRSQWLNLEDEKLKKSLDNISPDKVEAMIIKSNATAFKDLDKELIKNATKEFNFREKPIDTGSGILIYLKNENGG